MIYCPRIAKPNQRYYGAVEFNKSVDSRFNPTPEPETSPTPKLKNSEDNPAYRVIVHFDESVRKDPLWIAHVKDFRWSTEFFRVTKGHTEYVFERHAIAYVQVELD